MTPEERKAFDQYVAATITGLIANENFANADVHSDAFDWVAPWAVYIAAQTLQSRNEFLAL